MDDQTRALLERLEATLKQVRDEYGEDPNIVGIGWGSPSRGGRYRNEISIIFQVRHKYANEREVVASESTPIPREINGFPTDVVQSKPHRASSATGQRDETAYDPLIGGSASSNAEEHIAWFNGYGTLGLLCRDASDNTPLALSNWHVWADGGEEGDRIIQPGHPRTGDHLESLGKIAACGPLLTSVIEADVPSPLALGLYAGAAAVAITAALSDYADPFRRGQQNTPPDDGEYTLAETLEVALDFNELPWSGTPFASLVEWNYRRFTDGRELAYEVKEEQVNPQFLLGQYIATSRKTYEAGEVVSLSAAIWDYQPRPCDAYHAVAHLIPEDDPGRALRVVLHPSECGRNIPLEPPDEEPPIDNHEDEVCFSFAEFPAEQTFFPQTEFGWLSAVGLNQWALRIVDWWPAGEPDGQGELKISPAGIQFSHAPARRVRVRVAHFTGQPISLTAYDSTGQEVGSVATSDEEGVVHELVIEGSMINSTRIRGGGNEGVLLDYCIEPVTEDEVDMAFTPEMMSNLTLSRTLTHLPPEAKIRVRRCCFRGQFKLPPTEKPGRWNVHLVVQNVNHVPDGVPPEQAAGVIGGHAVTANVSITGCTAIMLADHVFDVI